MPVGALFDQFGRKGLLHTFPVQTGLYVSIFIHVHIIIIVKEFGVLDLPENYHRKDHKDRTNQDRQSGLISGGIRA